MAVRVTARDYEPEPPPRHVLRLAAPAAPLWKRTACVAARPLLLPLSSLAAVRTSEALVGLTFDDGPDPATTPAVLRGLARHDAKATFFMLSDRVSSYPEVARRVRDEGHEIALHGDDQGQPEEGARQHGRLVGAGQHDGQDQAEDRIEEELGRQDLHC